jgi:hypothetical protein
MRKGIEIAPGLVEQPVLERDDRVEIGRALWETPAWFTLARAEQSFLDKKVRADQQ